MKTLATAVVGLGRVGWQYHLPQIVEHTGFTLAAVVDPNPERLEEARASYQATGYASVADLLAAERLDLLVIASPTHFHADQAIAALEAGVDVFCDKPIAPSLAETDRMIDAMRRSGRKLMVYQPHRLTPEAMAVRAILDSGKLGELFLLKRALTNYVRRNDWQAHRAYGGGMLSNFGAHMIDQLLFLTGGSISQLTCHLRRMATLGDADDVVKALFHLDNGILLDLEIDMACSLPVPAWTIVGRHGAAMQTSDGTGFTLKYYRPDELPPLALQEGLSAAKRMYGTDEVLPWRTETIALADFTPPSFYDKCYDYFALDLPPFVPITETREVMRVIEACRQSAGWADCE